MICVISDQEVAKVCSDTLERLGVTTGNQWSPYLINWCCQIY